MSPYDRAHTISCLTLIETVCLIFYRFDNISSQIKLLTNNKSFSDTNNLYLSYSLKTRLVIPKNCYRFLYNISAHLSLILNTNSIVHTTHDN